MYGESETLKFPAFHKELLSQSYWSPVDDLGRVKVIIAEGLARKSSLHSFERLRNIVSFSFQHAPIDGTVKMAHNLIDLLEKSSIAWPNPSMWQNIINAGPFYSQTYSPRTSKENPKIHNQGRFHLSTKVALLRNPSSMHPLKDSVHGNNTNNSFTEPENLLTDPLSPELKYWNDASACLSLSDQSSSSTYTRRTNITRHDVRSSEDDSGKTYRNISEIKLLPQTIDTESSARNIDVLNKEEIDLFLGLDPGIFGPPKAENSDFLGHITDIELDYSNSSTMAEFDLHLPSSQTNQSLKRARSTTPAAVQDIDGENNLNGSMKQE
ncbi:hypothetical protein K3495_g271 [Podosphaera aphanis]|nr:hypothetical protein K3495_g271 [Podosphaera aphanis]